VVLKPLPDRWEGIAVGCGINPWYGREDPHAMAGCCIEEAVRNVVAVGADPCRIAILDNFCWGNVRDEKELGGLVRCVLGCRDAALAYGVPFISGKDSLNNFFVDETGSVVSIPGTLLISAVGIVPDIRRIVSSDLKRAGNPVYLLGNTRNELGGSQVCRMLQVSGGQVPVIRPGETRVLLKKLHAAIRRGLVASCHDCSEGGLFVAISEMVVGGGWGAEVHLDGIAREECQPAVLLFSESQGRFVVEVEESAREPFERLMRGAECVLLGRVVPEPVLRVWHRGTAVLEISRKELDEAWREALPW